MLEQSRQSDAAARKALLEKDAAHRVVVEAIERLLGELGVDAGASLVNRIGSAPGRT